MEIWKDIEGYEGLYQISNLGSVKSFISNKILRPGINKLGYYRCILSVNGNIKAFSVHRLVAIAFIDNPHNHFFVNHIDNNPSNNTVGNLEWCTQEHNQNHAQKTGNAVGRTGSNHYKSILTEAEVLRIIELAKTKRKNEIVKETGFNYQTINSILTGRSWNQITGLPRVRHYKIKGTANYSK